MTDSFYKVPPIYENQRKKMYDLKSSYPSAKIFSSGKSLTGRGIFTICIGKPTGAVLYAGGFHATEWLTCLMLYMLADDLLAAYYNDSCRYLSGIDIKNALDARGIIIIPCVNPDGLEILQCGADAAGLYKSVVEKAACGDLSRWNANARGVDINHNFNAGFKQMKEIEISQGIIRPSPRKYGGTKPESEPETLNLVRICKAFNVSRVYAFHSQGEEIYWKYGNNTPKQSQTMAEILGKMSGYNVTYPEETASHAGFKDWFIEKFRRPGFTVEIGRGENPLPLSDLQSIYARLVEMLAIGIVI